MSEGVAVFSAKEAALNRSKRKSLMAAEKAAVRTRQNASKQSAASDDAPAMAGEASR